MSTAANPIAPKVVAPTCNNPAHSAGCPTPSKCTPGGSEHGPCCLHLLPPHAQEGLKLTAEQQKQVSDLEVETKAKLGKILTPEQLQQLKQMRPPPAKGAPGSCTHGGKPV